MEENAEKSLDYDLFKKALRRKGLNLNRFHLESGISMGTITYWRKSRKIKKDELIEKVEKILGVKYADLCVPAEENLTNTRLPEPEADKEAHDHKTEWPIIGNSRGGAWLETIESGYPGVSEEWTAAPYGVIDENGYALRMLGDSMVPEFPEGSVVLVSPNGEVLSGQYAVVIIESRLDDRRESCVKQVFIHQDHITLHSLNPKYKDIDIPRQEVVAIHKIRECRMLTVKRYE